MAAQPDEYYQGLLNNFGVIQNNKYTYDTVYYNNNGKPNERSITRDSVEALNNGNRYFKVMGPAEYGGKEYIKIKIFEKGTNNRVGDDTSEFGLTERMGFDGLTPYQPPGGGNKRRRTKKSKKSKRRRSFK